MKKRTLTTAISLILCVLYMAAQDIIVTREEKRIEAKITEVSDTEIKYRDANNPDGPLFVMGVDKISTIIYSNGTVKVFEQPQAPAQSGTRPPISAQYQASLNRGQQPQAGGTEMISRYDDYYVMGNERMNEDQYLRFIQQTCPAAYSSYQKGKKLWGMGWGFFGASMACLSAGSVMYSLGRSDGSPGLVIPGSFMIGAGSGFFCASIPCLAVGNVKRRNSHEVYNSSCVRRSSPYSLNVGYGANGVGLAFAW